MYFYYQKTIYWGIRYKRAFLTFFYPIFWRGLKYIFHIFSFHSKKDIFSYVEPVQPIPPIVGQNKYCILQDREFITQARAELYMNRQNQNTVAKSNKDTKNYDIKNYSLRSINYHFTATVKWRNQWMSENCFTLWTLFWRFPEERSDMLRNSGAHTAV